MDKTLYQNDLNIAFFFTFFKGYRCNKFYYLNTNEIPGELSCENLVSSHVKITCYLHIVKISPLLWLHNKSHLSHQKTIKVKWFGSSLVFIKVCCCMSVEKIFHLFAALTREIFFNTQREISYLHVAM